MRQDNRVTAGITSALTVVDGELLRNGKTHRILSGALHYFRVHPDQWEDRLRRLAAMGVNTVDTYIAWNFHERVEGEADFAEWRDLERFITLAGDIGLDVYIRPSPYICAEWSNGGLPHWLTARVSALRSSDPEFLRAVTAWYDHLLPRLVPLQAAFGGPIVAVQLENEYGSFGSDTAYLEYLYNDLRERGFVELITTADGITKDMVQNGSVEGAMATFTFGTGVSKAVELRPHGAHLMCSELWGGWFDHWNEKHHVRSAESMISTVDELLAAGGSVSLYMAHGGTNYGLWNGANYDGGIQPTVTSYDSDAPIGEDGSIGEKFFALREAFAPFHDGELPPVPAQPTTQSAQTVPLVAAQSLYELVQNTPVAGEQTPLPLTFEQLGAEDGLVAYTATTWLPAGAAVSIEGLADRATVFADGVKIGYLGYLADQSVIVAEGDKDVELTIVVESLGRINYGVHTGAHKGILGGVVIDGRRFAHGWTHRIISQQAPASRATVSANDGVAVATVNVDRVDDAWIALPGSSKAMVWLNGFLLGRTWAIGPQITLYAPAPLWREGENEIVVLELEQLATTLELRESAEYGEVEEFIGS